jgi:hypothetical protein
MSYKIKIFCTSINELSLNDEGINRSIYDEIIYSLCPEDDDFIDKIMILYKYSKRHNIENFVVKSLEIICNTRLTKKQFIEYIKKMHDCGFKSKNNAIIEFINMENYETIYKYKFELIKSIEIKPRDGNYKNKSSYSVDTVYSIKNQCK